MSSYSRIALVGDIGGNHARFAISDVDELTITHYASFRRDLFASLEDAIRAYLNSVPQRPEMAGIAVASPLAGDRFAMTDGGWSFTHDDVLAATGARNLRLLNNFEAVALSLPHLTGHDLEKVCGGEPAEGAAKVALGPGTALGVAGLVPSDAAGWPFAARAATPRLPRPARTNCALPGTWRRAAPATSPSRTWCPVRDCAGSTPS